MQFLGINCLLLQKSIFAVLYDGVSCVLRLNYLPDCNLNENKALAFFILQLIKNPSSISATSNEDKRRRGSSGTKFLKRLIILRQINFYWQIFYHNQKYQLLLKQLPMAISSHLFNFFVTISQTPPSANFPRAKRIAQSATMITTILNF